MKVTLITLNYHVLGNDCMKMGENAGEIFVEQQFSNDSPKFSADAFISAMVRRPRAAPLGGFGLPAGECSD